MAAHIAVVDDEEDARMLVHDVLSREGYRVSLCADGQAFWTLVRADAPDLSLLDVRIPGENGLSLAKRIHAASKMGIIMLSGMGGVDDRVVGLGLGADDYLTKPFEPRELLARVKSVLRRRDGRPKVHPISGQIDSIAAKLETIGRQVSRIDEEARRIDRVADKLRHAKIEHCPDCGSRVSFHPAQAGELGICESCGWTLFFESGER